MLKLCPATETTCGRLAASTVRWVRRLFGVVAAMLAASTLTTPTAHADDESGYLMELQSYLQWQGRWFRTSDSTKIAFGRDICLQVSNGVKPLTIGNQIVEQSGGQWDLTTAISVEVIAVRHLCPEYYGVMQVPLNQQ